VQRLDRKPNPDHLRRALVAIVVSIEPRASTEKPKPIPREPKVAENVARAHHSAQQGKM
jgi:hypothetical protein